MTQQLNLALSMLPVWLSFIFAVFATIHTHADVHTDKSNWRESSLSLLKGENGNMKDSKHLRCVSHIKMKLMAL